MQILTLDFETYFSNEFTLKKLTTEHYIRDPRFSALLLGYRLPDGSKGWVGAEHIAAFLSQFDWSQTAILAHHAQFDGLIFSHHYNVRPCFWFDTLSMARVQLGNHVSVSLDSLSKHYRLPAKTVPYDMFRGRQWVNLDPRERQLLGDGAAHDCELTWEIFRELAKGFPREEYKLVDLSIRMFTEPKLVLDVPLLLDVVREEVEAKQSLLNELQVVPADLQSSAKFIELLEAEGVEVEYKGGKNGPIPALAKTDDFMKGLLEDENPRVAVLAEARLEVRSTISETRSQRLADMGSRGPATVYLKYAGAHTTRFSGGDSTDFQNFPGGHKSRLRSGVRAPRGTLLATVDSSQGECRLLNQLAGQLDVVAAFREKRDVYSEGAAHFYGKSINKKDNPKERQLGKIMELMLGFGAGDKRFRSQCRAGALGGDPIILSAEESTSAVNSYRTKHDKVVAYWKEAGRLIARLAGGEPVQWGPMTVETGKITLPNGLPLWYPDMRFNEEDIEGWSYKTRRGRVRIWGSKLIENVVQALHRVQVTQAILAIVAESGLPFVLMSHDDASFLINDDQHAQQTLRWLESKMRAAPAWLPDIPLDAEGVLGRDYGK